MTKRVLLSSQEKDTLRYKLEADLTTKVKEWLDVQRDVAWYKASDRYHKGISDCIINCCGFFIAAELKADDGEPTPHQNLFIKQNVGVGGIGGVCYTLGEVKALVQVAREKNIKMRCTTTK